MPRKPSSPNPEVSTPALEDKSLRMSYRIARGEQGVLTFEPYKSFLLPHWRFATPGIARESSSILKQKFDAYVAAGDFVGADMARKFLQMGMTRAARYANHAGGRKYAKQVSKNSEKKVELPRGPADAKMREKRECSAIFRCVWETAKKDEEYLRLRRGFVEEQAEWDKQQKEDEK